MTFGPGTQYATNGETLDDYSSPVPDLGEDGDAVNVQRGLVGKGPGDDAYIFSETLMDAGTEITVSDAQGGNYIQFILDFGITGSAVASNTLQVTTTAGTMVEVLDSAEFTYVLGGNPVLGTFGAQVDFATMTEALGYDAPPDEGEVLTSDQSLTLTEALVLGVVTGIALGDITLGATTDGLTTQADGDDVVFDVEGGTYDTTIEDFGAGDVLSYQNAVMSVTIDNPDPTDGQVIVETAINDASDAINGVQTLTLEELDEVTDASFLDGVLFEVTADTGSAGFKLAVLELLTAIQQQNIVMAALTEVMDEAFGTGTVVFPVSVDKEVETEVTLSAVDNGGTTFIAGQNATITVNPEIEGSFAHTIGYFREGDALVASVDPVVINSASDDRTLDLVFFAPVGNALATYTVTLAGLTEEADAVIFDADSFRDHFGDDSLVVDATLNETDDGGDDTVDQGGDDTVDTDGAETYALTNDPHDAIAAGAGDDTITGAASGDLVETDTVDGGEGTDTLEVTGIATGTDDATLTGVEIIIWSGTDSTDSLSLAGQSEGFQVTLIDATGSDSVVLGAGADTVTGGTFADRIAAGDGADSVDSGDDADSVEGEGGADTLLGGAGNDTLDGGLGADSLDGGLGNDQIIGGKDDDTLLGQWGTDALFGEDGNDTLSGGTSDDTLTGGAGDDTLDGGTGTDWAVFSGEREYYGITYNSDGSVTVIDYYYGEGTDTLTNVENVQFSDQWVALDV